MHVDKLIAEYSNGVRDFKKANLSVADLRWANLRGANLPSPTMVLLASWGDVSPTLCRDLMRLDAWCHDSPKMFDEWVKNYICPYGGKKFERACNFTEEREHWSPGRPPKIFSLMVRLLQEKCADSDYHVKE